MKNIHDELYAKITQVSIQVKNELRKKGIVVPVQNKDGSVTVGNYRIVKNRAGFYSILDKDNDIVVDYINLPQAAAVLANGLALGKFKDTALIESDQRYGYALFDEMVHTRAIKLSKTKSLEQFEITVTKNIIARARKENYKNDVIKSFEKLIKLV